MQLCFNFDEPLPKIYHLISMAYIRNDYICIYDLSLKHGYFTHVDNSWRSKKNV